MLWKSATQYNFRAKIMGLGAYIPYGYIYQASNKTSARHSYTLEQVYTDLYEYAIS